jgi:hypothetical protein
LLIEIVEAVFQRPSQLHEEEQIELLTLIHE